MLFNEIVIQENAKRLLDEFEVRTVLYEEPGYYTASSVESLSTITSKAVKAGLSVFNCVSAEDVVVKAIKFQDWSSTGQSRQ